MPGSIARKWPLAIRLVELLHKEPAIWAPYKEMFLPERVQTEFTMTSDEVRNRLKLAPSKINVDDYEEKLGQLQAQFDHGLTAMAKLASIILPDVAISPPELRWAFTIVQSRAVNRNGRAELIPLFDMLNHAQDNTCDFCHVPVEMSAEVRSMMATEVAPTQLRVAWIGPDLVLFRGDAALGRLDDCCIILAPEGGLRAGEEAFFAYHDTSEYSLSAKLGFLMQFGFLLPS